MSTRRRPASVFHDPNSLTETRSVPPDAPSRWVSEGQFRLALGELFAAAPDAEELEARVRALSWARLALGSLPSAGPVDLAGRLADVLAHHGCAPWGDQLLALLAAQDWTDTEALTACDAAWQALRRGRGWTLDEHLDRLAEDGWVRLPAARLPLGSPRQLALRAVAGPDEAVGQGLVFLCSGALARLVTGGPGASGVEAAGRGRLPAVSFQAECDLVFEAQSDPAGLAMSAGVQWQARSLAAAVHQTCAALVRVFPQGNSVREQLALVQEHGLEPTRAMELHLALKLARAGVQIALLTTSPELARAAEVLGLDAELADSDAWSAPA